MDGNWGNLKKWSKCSSTCGSGEKIRHRYCDSPHRSVDGLPCQGIDMGKEICENNELCPGK